MKKYFAVYTVFIIYICGQIFNIIVWSQKEN